MRETSQEELKEAVRQYLKDAEEDDYIVALHIVHFPDILEKSLVDILYLTRHFVSDSIKHLRETTGWQRKKDDNTFCFELRREFKLDRKEVMRLIPEIVYISGYRYVTSTRGKTNTLLQRVNRLGRHILTNAYPQYCYKRDGEQGLKEPLRTCVLNMHHQELEYWLRYLVTEDCKVFNLAGYNASTPFDPRMVYPNIQPDIAQHLVTNAKFIRDWSLYTILNSWPPERQYRHIFPPVKKGKYSVYPFPANQYELSGFSEKQISNKAYIVSKASPSNRDSRAQLLNCVNIIQQNMPPGESGVQAMRRIMGCLVDVIRGGDNVELQTWMDAYTKAPGVPCVSLEDIDYASYMRGGVKRRTVSKDAETPKGDRSGGADGESNAPEEVSQEEVENTGGGLESAPGENPRVGTVSTEQGGGSRPSTSPEEEGQEPSGGDKGLSPHDEGATSFDTVGRLRAVLSQAKGREE